MFLDLRQKDACRHRRTHKHTSLAEKRRHGSSGGEKGATRSTSPVWVRARRFLPKGERQDKWGETGEGAEDQRIGASEELVEQPGVKKMRAQSSSNPYWLKKERIWLRTVEILHCWDFRLCANCSCWLWRCYYSSDGLILYHTLQQRSQSLVNECWSADASRLGFPTEGLSLQGCPPSTDNVLPIFRPSGCLTFQCCSVESGNERTYARCDFAPLLDWDPMEAIWALLC